MLFESIDSLRYITRWLRGFRNSDTFLSWDQRRRHFERDTHDFLDKLDSLFSLAWDVLVSSLSSEDSGTQIIQSVRRGFLRNVFHHDVWLYYCLFTARTSSLKWRTVFTKCSWKDDVWSNVTKSEVTSLRQFCQTRVILDCPRTPGRTCLVLLWF